MDVKLLDIAAKAKVSPITVSRALRGLGVVHPNTRERIQQIAVELGYSKRKGVLTPQVSKNRASSCLKVVLSLFAGVADSEMFSRIAVSVAMQPGCRLIDSLRKSLHNSGGLLDILILKDIDEYLERVPRRKDNGIVLRQNLPQKWLDMLTKFAPVVQALDIGLMMRIDSVWLNERRASSMIREKLLLKGHTDIAFLGIKHGSLPMHIITELYGGSEPIDQLSADSVDKRYSQWISLGFNVHNQHTKTHVFILQQKDAITPVPEELTIGAIDKILQIRPRVTAIVCPNDPFAKSIMQFLERKGLRVPEDISIVCYCGVEKPDSHSPALSSLLLPMEQIGEAIPELIERRLAKPDAVPISLELDPCFYDGQTLGPAKK